MRKRIVSSSSRSKPPAEPGWLDLEAIAEIELTSEDAAYPIEGAVVAAAGSGWRAAEPGEQTIRFVFDQPQHIKRIWLHFEESSLARTQEFALRWLPDGGAPQEIVRQQWNFSPPATTEEIEDYRVDLAGVRMLELNITPDISGGAALASLRQMRLAGLHRGAAATHTMID